MKLIELKKHSVEEMETSKAGNTKMKRKLREYEA